MKTEKYLYADTKACKILQDRIDDFNGVKTQRELAAEMGYEKPNILSMFKRGESKIPLEKVPAIAKALKIDPAQFYKAALEQSWPDHHETVEEIFGMIVSRRQREWLSFLCEVFDETDPALTVERAQAIRTSLKQI